MENKSSKIPKLSVELTPYPDVYELLEAAMQETKRGKTSIVIEALREVLPRFRTEEKSRVIVRVRFRGILPEIGESLPSPSPEDNT